MKRQLLRLVQQPTPNRPLTILTQPMPLLPRKELNNNSNRLKNNHPLEARSDRSPWLWESHSYSRLSSLMFSVTTVLAMTLTILRLSKEEQLNNSATKMLLNNSREMEVLAATTTKEKVWMLTRL